MKKSSPTSKSSARENSTSRTTSSLAAALFGVSKISISVAAPQVGKSSQSATSSPAPGPESGPLSIVSVRASSSHGLVSNSKSLVFATPTSRTVASDIFSKNASKCKQDISLPKVGEDIETTAQLVACADLLAWTDAKTLDSTNTIFSMDDLSPSQAAWTQQMNDRPLEKEYIRQQLNRMVDAFVVFPIKTFDTICDIILLGPVLDRVHYRALLNEFLHNLESSVILNTDILQGLVRLVECAPPFFLRADALTKILRVIRKHLTDSAQQEIACTIHLVVAISKVLVIMVECGVKDLNREEEHEPLLQILCKLRKHTDPLVRYHVEYACRALYLVPDDETLRQGFTRNTIGLVGGLLSVPSVIQLDFSGIKDALPVLIKSGQGLVNNLKKYFGLSNKNPWFQDVRKAQVMVSEGRLVDFNHLICEADCRQDPLFQWGICLLLGEIAFDPSWDSALREQAIRLLGEIFKSNSGSDKHRDVRRWILTLLHNISEHPRADLSVDTDNEEVKQQTLDMALELGNIGDEKAFSLQYSYLAKHCYLSSLPSKQLKVVDKTPSFELALDRFRRQRQEMYNRSDIYIPPMSKPSLNASDENADPLHERVHRFLEGNGLVMLILGDSGGGKSTFNIRLEQDLWDTFSDSNPIPLLIDLKAIHDLDQDLIQQHLDSLHVFSASHMDELRSKEFILICDGYDESQCRSNLHTNNQFNGPRQWRARMVISCRSQYLPLGYQSSFAPQQDAIAHLSLSLSELFTEAVVVPFKLDQIKDYITQYVMIPDTSDNNPKWTAEQYMERLAAITNATDLIQNPFMLKMILDTLPKISITTTQITRAELYDEFVYLHYKNELHRLKEQLSRGKMDYNRFTAFRGMERIDFAELGIDFSKRLAEAIFRNKQGVNSVEYGSLADSESWKRQFFGPEPRTQILMEASQLSQTGTLDSQEQTKNKRRSAGKVTFRFSHMSLLEYFYALSVYDPAEDLPHLDPTDSLPLTGDSHCLTDHPLSRQNLVGKPAILQFLADRVQHCDDFKNFLHILVLMSRNSMADTSVSYAATNAITILVRAGERFNDADLKGIRIPGADLSSGDFDSAQLQGADLRNTILRNVWMHQADLSKAHMEGAKFGEYPYLEVEGSVLHCAFSRDGEHLAVGLSNGAIVVYRTSSWDRVLFPVIDAQTGTVASSLTGHTGDVKSVAFSPSGHQIASGSSDMTLHIWDAQSGALVSTFNGHTEAVSSVMFSPSGHQIASGSHDKTVRLWNAQTGTFASSLIGHTGGITSVAFSPNGLQIISGSHDNTVRLWDAQTGALVHSLSGHTSSVVSVAFSPSGQIASASWDQTVRLWDAQTGSLSFCLKEDTGDIFFVAYSHSGHQIVSGGNDRAVRVWDAQNGTLVSSMRGHSKAVNCVAFSPADHSLIASGGWDKTVRLWDAQTRALTYSMGGHISGVSSVTFSPDGFQITSASNDETVMLWDAQSGTRTSSMKGHTRAVSSAVYSPSGLQIASGSWDNTVRVWDVQTGGLAFSLSGHTSRVHSVAYSPSGHQIASASGDKTMRLWDAYTGALISSLTDHTGEVNSVAFSPNGLLIASGSNDKTVRLWDAQTGVHASSLTGHTSDVTSVTFSPSGHQIASGSMDMTVRLWDAQTGASVTSLSGHNRWVTTLAYSPSGDKIASGGDDDSVRLWDTASGQCLVILGGFQDTAFGIAWKETRDGLYLAIGGSARTVNMWKVIEDANQIRLCLQWRSTPDRLVLKNASIQGVHDSSEINLRLMQQRGAVGQPIAL